MSNNILTTIFFLVIGTMVLISCAKTGSLTGGPVDKIPPKINHAKSDSNFQTNFTQKEIVLVFDEFVELKSLDKNLLISPPMVTLPKIIQRGKKITIKIAEEEQLREDATYSIDFGKSIVDFTAGNAIEDYKFVFATGDKLDSLSLTGTIVNAYNDEPIVGAYIMLYDILTDSIVAKERPFYLVKTDESGKFELNNLKSDTFKVVTLEDFNFNYIFDLPSEGFGYSDDFIFLTDSSSLKPTLKLFYKEDEVSLISKNFKIFGLMSFIYSQPTDTLDVSLISPQGLQTTIERSKDTLNIWYSNAVDSIMISIEKDTFKSFVPVRDSIFDKKNIKFYQCQKVIGPWQTIELLSNVLLDRIDTSLIILYETTPNSFEAIVVDSSNLIIDSLSVDSTAFDDIPTDKDSLGVTNPDRLDSTFLTTPEVQYDTTVLKKSVSFKDRTLSVLSDWNEKSKVFLTLLPGAAIDIYGRSNDTLEFEVNLNRLEDYGNIIAELREFSDSVDYVLELYNEKEKIKTDKISEIRGDTIRYSRLTPGTYSFLLIEDRDGNGRWTTGDYWKDRQPEKLKRISLETLKANWDLRAPIKWAESANESNSFNSSETSSDSIDQINPAYEKGLPKLGDEKE